MKRNILVLADSGDEVRAMADFLIKRGISDFSSVFFYSESELVAAEASQLDLNIITESSVVSESRLHRANEEAFELATRWHSDSLIDRVLLFRNVSLAGLIDKDFSYSLIRLIRRLLVVKNAVDSKEIDEIVIASKKPAKIRSARWQSDECILPLIGEGVGKVNGVMVTRVKMTKALPRRAFPLIRPRVEMTLRHIISWLHARFEDLAKNGNNAAENDKVFISGSPSFLFPIAEELQKSAETEVFYYDEILGPKIVKTIFEKKIRGCSVYSTNASLAQGKRQLLKELYSFDWEEFESCLNNFFKIDEFPLIELLRERLRYFVLELLPALGAYMSRLSQLLCHLHVNWVLVDEDVSEKKKALVLAARCEGIKSAVLMHGVPGRKIGYAPLSADYMLTWGCQYVPLLEHWGIKAGQIIVTGNPRYDKLPSTQRSVSFADVGLPKDWTSTRIILLALNMYRTSWKQCFYGESYSYLEMKENIKKVCGAIHGLENLSLIVKLHPRDQNPQSYQKMLDEIAQVYPGLRFVLMQKQNIFDLIHVSDLILTVGSSVAVDALRCGRAAVLLDFYERDQVYSYFDPTGIPRLKTEAELRDFLKLKLISGENLVPPLEVCEKFFFRNDKNSGRRVAEFILSGEAIGGSVGTKASH